MIHLIPILETSQHPNTHLLRVFLAPKSHRGPAQYLSYEIMGMGVVYKGNNQLAEVPTPMGMATAEMIYGLIR